MSQPNLGIYIPTGNVLELATRESRERTQWDHYYALHGDLVHVLHCMIVAERPAELGFEGGGGACLGPMKLHDSEEVDTLNLLDGVAHKWRADSCRSAMLDYTQQKHLAAVRRHHRCTSLRCTHICLTCSCPPVWQTKIQAQFHGHFTRLMM